VKAAVFYVEGQEALYRAIRRLLGEEIFEDIDVEQYKISRNYSWGSGSREHEACRSYLRMLRACMIRVEDFRIVVGNPPFSWCYLGYEADDPMFADRVLQISRDKLGAVFPAVAVRDRMVMVPIGIRDAFHGNAQLSWFLKPLDLQGVGLVDFADLKFVREEMHQVGRQIEREVVKLCARYAQMRNIRRPDFDELSDLLEIDVSYLQQHQDRIIASLIQMTPRVRSGPVRLGKPSQVVLDITEGSGNTLKRARVRVRGPRGTLSAPVGAILDFTAADPASRMLHFEVVAKVRPYLPLEVRFEPDVEDETYTAFPVPVILDVTA
jgi:hypothetical protein